MSSSNQAAAAVATKPSGLKRVVLQAAAVLYLFAFSAYSLRNAYQETSRMLSSPESLQGPNRSLSVAGSSNSSRCHHYDIITDIRLSEAKEIISPTTYLASFHGSGTEITSNLVQALTGISTTNQINYAKQRRADDHSILIETHYPAHDSSLTIEEDDSNYRGTILLLRNPIDAILSSFNTVYTQQHRLSHTAQTLPPSV